MQKELLSKTNPNYLHGCYPLDLSDYFGESPFSLIFKKPQTPLQQMDTCLQASPRERLKWLIVLQRY